MGKSWKRRQMRARRTEAREAVDNILTTTAAMSQTIDEVINTMKISEVIEETPPTPTVKKRTRRVTASKTTAPKRTASKTTTIVDTIETTD